MNLKTQTLSVAFCCCAAAFAAAACNQDAREGTNNRAASNSANAATRQSGANTNLDAEIERLEKQAERSPGEDSVTQALAAAYVRRGDALRAANDLRGALKEYRSAIKYDEDNEEAQKKIAELVPQVEGEKTGEYGEPEPLPITPSVTTDKEDPSPTRQPAPRKNVNRKS